MTQHGYAVGKGYYLDSRTRLWVTRWRLYDPNGHLIGSGRKYGPDGHRRAFDEALDIKFQDITATVDFDDNEWEVSG